MSKASTPSWTANLFVERTTKNAVRYREVDDTGEFKGIPDALIGTIYVRTAKMGRVAPRAVKVTIEPLE